MTQIYYYSAPWCAPCRVFGPIVDKVVGESGVEYVKVNVEAASEGELKRAIKHGVDVVPTLVKEVNGQMTARIEGATTEEALKSFLGV